MKKYLTHKETSNCKNHPIFFCIRKKPLRFTLSVQLLKGCKNKSQLEVIIFLSFIFDLSNQSKIWFVLISLLFFYHNSNTSESSDDVYNDEETGS